MKTTIRFKFGKEETGKVVPHKYANNNRSALRFIDDRTGEPIATLTVNMPKFELEKDEVFIKSYNENAGVVESLIANGLVDVLGESKIQGIWKCRLREQLKKLIANE